MDIEWVRQHCLSFPHTTENVQWQDDLVFKIGGRMYAVVALGPGDHWLSFKCTPEEFAELADRPGIIPAPYLARAHWVSLTGATALPVAEIKRLLRQAYALVLAKLPKRSQADLAGSHGLARAASSHGGIGRPAHSTARRPPRSN
jgi:predicted DNA-binding protein (MmcQ/YjbR family)